MKKLLIILVIITGLIGGGIYYLFQPKTLGIKYTPQDLESIKNKVNVNNESLPANTPLSQSLVVSGSHPVEATFSSEELSAGANYRRSVYKYFPFKNVQIRVNNDGSVEGSAKVNFADGVNYLLTLGVSSSDIEKGAEKFKIPKADFPVYLKVGGNIENNKSNINVSAASIANIPIPQNLIQEYGPGINNLVEGVIEDRSPSYNIEKLEVVEGKVHFKGTSPDIEKTVR